MTGVLKSLSCLDHATFPAATESTSVENNYQPLVEASGRNLMVRIAYSAFPSLFLLEKQLN